MKYRRDLKGRIRQAVRSTLNFAKFSSDLTACKDRVISSKSVRRVGVQSRLSRQLILQGREQATVFQCLLLR